MIPDDIKRKIDEYMKQIKDTFDSLTGGKYYDYTGFYGITY